MSSMKKLTLTLALCLNFSSLSALAAPFCVAHRALGFGELENSYSAIEAAAKAGAAAIEFDLLHTKDGETIIYHDDILERLVEGDNTCPRGNEIINVNSKELENCKLTNGDSIPTFANTMEMLAQYDSTLFIEVKDKVTHKDLAVLMKTFPNPQGKIVIISFSQKVLRTIKSYRETVPYLNDVKLVLVKKIGVRVRGQGLDGVDINIISKRMVGKLKKQGHLVGVYTKNSEKQIQKAIVKGVDFITTNEYELCSELVK